MISCAIRTWLYSLTIMSVAGWATAACSFLVLYIDKALGAAVLALLMLWTAAVPIPATIQLIRWWQRARVARRVLLLGEKHAGYVRLFDNAHGETRSVLR
ncbi:hypothetical protein [Nonomuraea sp. NPDC049784]|uniref:hypothetical protein n=1 Tax=Nonomuraea sp. NPDC049784 TaxID=3154361 RepID=UPI0033C46B63